MIHIPLHRAIITGLRRTVDPPWPRYTFGMDENGDLRPVSPLGQRFPDMTATHALLRKDSHRFLARLNSLEKAMATLHTVFSSDLPPGASAELHKSHRGNAAAEAFFAHNVFSVQHWEGMFELLKSAGYTDKMEVANETSKHINRFVHNGLPLPLSERVHIGEAARHALEVVYKKEKD